MDDFVDMDVVQEKFMALQVRLQASLEFMHVSWNGVLDGIVDQLTESVRIAKAVRLAVLEEYSADRVGQYLVNGVEWGRLGWTMHNDMPFRFLFDAPGTYEDACMAVGEYCSDEYMSKLFDALLVHDVDGRIVGSVDCYNRGEYRCCVLVLFSEIDRRLIKLQDKSLGRRGHRSVGLKAIKNVCDGDVSVESMVEFNFAFTRFWELVLYSCLSVMFAQTDDFSIEMTVINRNYVMHGMEPRCVTRIDCIQVFWVLWNVMLLLTDELSEDSDGEFGDDGDMLQEHGEDLVE